jgi:APA family basic amino acid/polyamine antiporter
MARDGLLPQGLARVSQNGAPVRVTLFTAVIVGTIAALFPLSEIVALANAGTLVAFSAVALCMLIMRRRAPHAPRGLRTPAAWLVGPVALLGCAYLFVSLPAQTQAWFMAWNIAGIVFYLFHVRRKSTAQTSPAEVKTNGVHPAGTAETLI